MKEIFIEVCKHLNQMHNAEAIELLQQAEAELNPIVKQQLLQQAETAKVIKLIDMDKGQADNYELRPNLKFPSALVRVSLPKYEELGQGKKLATAQATIRLVFDGATAAQRTGTSVQADALAASLAYLDLAQANYEAFKNFNPENLNLFEITEWVQENRTDGLVIIRQSFTTSIFDME